MRIGAVSPRKDAHGQMLERSIFGSQETVATGIERLVAETGADELMIVSDVYDHDARLRSHELIAQSQDAVLSAEATV